MSTSAAPQSSPLTKDPLLEHKVLRYYSRIFGNTLMGKIPAQEPNNADGESTKDKESNAAASPSSPADTTTTASTSTTATTTAAQAKKGRYAASEEVAVAKKHASDVIRKVKTVDALRASAFNNREPSSASASASASAAGVPVGAGGNIDYIMLYFSASWCPPCRTFTPMLTECYKAINKKHLQSVVDRAEFAVVQQAQLEELEGVGASSSAPQLPKLAPKTEVIFVSGCETFEKAEEYFIDKQGDWLMIPFEETKVRDSLLRRFEVTAFPTLIVLDAATGKVVCKKAVEAIYQGRAAGGGAEGFSEEQVVEQFPWRSESIIDKLDKEAVITKPITITITPPTTTSSLSSALSPEEVEASTTPTATTTASSAAAAGTTAATTTTAANTKKEKTVKIKSLEHVALYFASHASAPCRAFTPLLCATYEDLIMKKFTEEQTEVIYVPMDENEEHYKAFRAQMPFAALSFQHPIIPYLVKNLQVQTLPKLVTISVADSGKILNSDCRAALAEEVDDFNPDGNSSDEEEEEKKEKTSATTGTKTTNNTKGMKCGYPWAKSRLPLVAPLVPSADIINGIKQSPCVVLATNNASNAEVLKKEFFSAAEAYERGLIAELEAEAAAAANVTAGTANSAASESEFLKQLTATQRREIETYDPERNVTTSTNSSAGASSPSSPLTSSSTLLANESDGKRVQFLVADASHVGSEQLLQRLVMLLQENIPPSGVACVFSFDLKENLSLGSLKTIQSKEIIDYTKRFVKMCEDAIAASPAKNLQSMMQQGREHPQQGVPRPSRQNPNQSSGSGGERGGANSSSGSGGPSQQPQPQQPAQPPQQQGGGGAADPNRRNPMQHERQ